MGQGGHLSWKTPGYLAYGQLRRDHHVAGPWTPGSELCCPLVAFFGNITRQQVQMSIPLPIPLHGASSVLPSISFSSLLSVRRVHPLPSDSHPSSSCSGFDLTSGVGKPFRVFPAVHPKGRESSSSYSAGSQRASALLAAPSAGFFLKRSRTRPQPVSVRSGAGVRFSSNPTGIPWGRTREPFPKERRRRGGASQMWGF